MDKIRKLDILLYEGLNILDVAGLVQAFSTANEEGPTRYRLRYVSQDGSGVMSSCGLRLQADQPFCSRTGQDLVVPGGAGVDRMLQQPQFLELIRSWFTPDSDRRVISVCSGALLLAASGLLDGRYATTHWRRENEARVRFPEVNWVMNELYRIDGQIYTSAGVSSGIDLALEIINRDHGAAAALSVAREMVVFLKRSGGQTQFSDLVMAQFSADAALSRLVSALHDKPAFDWTLDSMADVAGLTPRTLVRRFSATVGQSPVKFLERYRVKRASEALSNGAPVGRCVQISGFSDFQHMQRAFKRQLGTTVGRYADRFSKE